MGESVASALEFVDNDATQQTWLFIRMMNKFFDCLNVKSAQLAKLKRNDNIAPYTSPTDERIKLSTQWNMLVYDNYWWSVTNPLRMRSRVCLSVCLSVTALAARMLSYGAQAWYQGKHIYKVFDSWILLKALCLKVMPSFTSPIATAITL